MQMSRIKNIVIAVLLLLNIFFLVIYVKNTAYEQAKERQMLDGVNTLLMENGIELLPNAISKQKALHGLTGHISAETEEQIALALIGDSEKTDNSSTVYSGNGGSVSFRAGGEFSAEISSTVQEVTNIEADAQTRLHEMGITADIISAEDNSVDAVCIFSGAEIFNCTIRFDYENGALRSVSGRYVSEVTTEKKHSNKFVGASTALMALLELKKETGDEITEITEVSIGYIMSVSVFGDVEFSSVFRITTDIGNYYINAQTGKEERL